LAIKASFSKQIDALIADLGAVSPATQEAAVARLTVAGTRAVERLIAAAASGNDVAARAAAWRTLEAIGDERAREPALQALADLDLDQTLAVAAAGVARVHVRGPHGASAVDRLTAVLLDPTRADAVRLAALRALRTLDPATIAPILASLAGDPSATVRAEADLRDGSTARGVDRPATVVIRAAERGLPDDPVALRQALSRSGGAVPLPLLLRIVERVREREASAAAAGREEWTLARAAAHVALAHRGSRLALYDLRESLDASAVPLPVECLEALSLVGDASCLEAIAAAYARARDAWWRQHLADAFRTIVAREKLTRRHAVIRRIGKRLPQTLLDVWSGAGRSGRSGRAGGSGSGKSGRAGGSGKSGRPGG
jgi:HEAT repeat protein